MSTNSIFVHQEDGQEFFEEFGTVVPNISYHEEKVLHENYNAVQAVNEKVRGRII